jgi:hypothetical protein
MTETWVILPGQDDRGTASYGVHEDKDNRLRQRNGTIARADATAPIAVEDENVVPCVGLRVAGPRDFVKHTGRLGHP